MKTFVIDGTEYLLVPGRGCMNCVLGFKDPYECEAKYPSIKTEGKGFFCGPEANDYVNHILRPNTPEERAEAFAQKASKA